MIVDKSIAIHNFSARNLAITRIEHFNESSLDPVLQPSCFASIVKSLAKPINKNTRNRKQLQTETSESKPDSRALTSDFPITIPPYSTKPTTVNLEDPTFQGQLRLILQDHRCNNTTCTVKPSHQHVNPPTSTYDDGSEAYHCIRHPTSRLLTILPNLNYREWMSAIPDHTALSSISIPGTHNSATCHRALPSVRCQAVSIIEQLNNGIRFFDIRLQVSQNPKNRQLLLVHAVFPISLTSFKKFDALLDDICNFLKAHPSEAVTLSLKREGVGKATDTHLARVLHKHYIESSLWFVEPRIPTLAEIRGKVVLVRRFALPPELSSLHDGRGWGINAEDWTYNSADCLHGDVRVQDFCEVLRPSQVEEKIRYCCAHFERAAALAAVGQEKKKSSSAPTPPPLHLNFLSGSNFWKIACWPERISAKLNPAALAFLCERHGACTSGLDPAFARHTGVGTVICDWVGENDDWDLVKCIIATNSHLFGESEGNGRLS